MLKASTILDIPVFVTTQLRSKLGPTDSSLDLDAYHPVAHVDKSVFSMWIPAVQTEVDKVHGKKKMQVVIVGIESHICVLQTTLDLLHAGHDVYVLADGVSSCNREEVPIALARMRAEGARVTTSESWLYECMGDASISQFRSISVLVKETKDDTKTTLEALCKI
jgi:nicotinamidase-related amidase